MKLFTRFLDEGGSGVVDFIGFGVLLQIPVLMFTTFALVQQHEQFALEAISRHSIRAHVLVPDYTSTERVIAELAQDFGIDESRLVWTLSCQPDSKCLQPGTLVSLEVQLGGLSASALQGN